jgi:hypothetical protein
MTKVKRVTEDEDIIPIPGLENLAPVIPLPDLELTDDDVLVANLGTEESDKRGDASALPTSESGPGPVKRRRRYRRKTTEPDIAEEVTMSEDERLAFAVALGVAFRSVGNIVASRRGPHWQFTEQEEALLGDQWATALAPFMGGSSKYVPLAMACIITAGTIVPRLERDRINAAEPGLPIIVGTVQ